MRLPCCYEGNWVLGKKEGSGIYTYNHHDSASFMMKYDGLFKGDKKNGKGKWFIGENFYCDVIYKDDVGITSRGDDIDAKGNIIKK